MSTLIIRYRSFLDSDLHKNNIQSDTRKQEIQKHTIKRSLFVVIDALLKKNIHLYVSILILSKSNLYLGEVAIDAILLINEVSVTPDFQQSPVVNADNDISRGHGRQAVSDQKNRAFALQLQ